MNYVVNNKNRLSFSFLRLTQTTLLAVLLTGCATTYKADSTLIKDFKRADVPTDKTGLYVIRGSNFVGAARGLWVAVNDSVVADLSNGSHVYLELDAGLNTLHFVQGKSGHGYLAIDNKPGETLYAKFGYATDNLAMILDSGLGQTMVMKTSKVMPLIEKRNNDAYDNLVINPGLLSYPIMIESPELLTTDKDHALVRFYRPETLIADIAFDIWNQDGYVGSTKGGTYFSAKLLPGHHVFISKSERYSVLDAELEAGKEYAVELDVGMGWNQAHIKLLPMDLSTEKGNQQAMKWRENLKATLLNQELIESDAMAKRIKTGFEYLENERKAIASGDAPKRSLPATFGN
ncbi:MAG: DUF2846 domain-containing protein [Pseudomonadales bacterium]|nr:DUF2846 domain-containing protein [Pseudomonadales bacterium]